MALIFPGGEQLMETQMSAIEKIYRRKHIQVR
jgi:hypothetical protein